MPPTASWCRRQPVRPACHLFDAWRKPRCAACRVPCSAGAKRRFAGRRPMAPCGSATSSVQAASAARHPGLPRGDRSAGTAAGWLLEGSRTYLAGHCLRRGGGRRFPEFRVLQRRDEHRAVPAPDRGLPLGDDAANQVIVLRGGSDFWSNGIHLNTIEAAGARPTSRGPTSTPSTTWPKPSCAANHQLTVAAVGGNTGAGGCFLAVPPILSGCAMASCSTRITRTWATCSVRNSGPTCSRRVSGGRCSSHHAPSLADDSG